MSPSTSTTTPSDRPTLVLADLAGSRRRNRIETGVRSALGLASTLSIIVSFAIVAVLVVRSAGFLSDIELSSLWSGEGWNPRVGSFDLATIFAGSFWVTTIAVAVATPLGIGAAIFMSEYASRRSRRILKPVIEVLAGIPSVVVAFFVLQTIHPSILEPLFGLSRFTLLGAGVGVGILTVPIIATITEDALGSVPHSLREASAGLGARKVTTSLRVVFPAALSGVTAAMIVGASRALGETMLVTLTAGGAGNAPRSFDAADKGLSMTSAMANLAAGSDNVTVAGGVGYNPVDSLYLVGLLLFVFTLGMNVLGDRLVRRFRQSY